MRIVLALCAALAAPTIASAADLAEGDAAACMARNIPEPDTIRAVRVESRDRAGSSSESWVRIYSRGGGDDTREVRFEFVEPEQLQGSAVLFLERPGETEVWFQAPDLPEPRRIRHGGRGVPLLGTDFSYEDVEHLLAFRHPGETRQLEDDRVEGRPAWVFETVPDPEQGSAYGLIRSYVDQTTCLPVRTELYEIGKGLRKQLLINPTVLHRKGQQWIPQIAEMQDLLNDTSTVILVDSTEQRELAKDLFRIDAAAKTP